MGRSLSLEAAAWAAIIAADEAEPLGATGPATEIPAALRRRLPAFSREMIRCTLPLLREGAARAGDRLGHARGFG
ncbi:MAG: hypothetical protein NVV62_11945 [Terricaulis sp.]|nr:hypothetical protein [Terricaulis sp.]